MRSEFVTLALVLLVSAGPIRRQEDPQTSLTLDPAAIAPGFANDGQGQPTVGQVASLTSKNNFINFCLTAPNLPLTNGQQIRTGSCNPAPMGLIPSTQNMPSSKFVFPPNGATIEPDTAFTIQMAISNLETGNFVNALENYFSAPQQLNGQGIIKGHSHVVVQQLSSLSQTTPTDPTIFAFFKGLNGAAEGGVLSASVDKGLPAGFYRLASINTAANHQPVLVPIAQHGFLDDAVYFTVAEGAQALDAVTGGNAGAQSTSTGVDQTPAIPDQGTNTGGDADQGPNQGAGAADDEGANTGGGQGANQDGNEGANQSQSQDGNEGGADDGAGQAGGEGASQGAIAGANQFAAVNKDLKGGQGAGGGRGRGGFGFGRDGGR
ncbi:hypothetical protein BDN72DRAFT_829844, partial [Pluteus cervinus]